MTASAAALSLALDDDRISLHARGASLSDLMHQFAHFGVDVAFDPAIDVRITANVDGASLERTLEELLDAFTYVLTWDVVPGPLGPLTRLAEIAVYTPGQRERAQPLPDVFSDFQVVRAGDGSGVEFIADEIIIGFAPGADINAIRVLIRELGGTVVDSLPDLGLYRIRLPPGTNIPALVARLARNPLVAEAEPNYAYRLPPTQPRTGAASPNLQTVPVPRPDAAPVAVLDSGLSMMPELDGLVLGGYNALHPNRDPVDVAGHGTQMALIASGALSPDGRSTDAGVPVLAIRSFDDQGVTSNFAMMRSILHAASEGARVLNLSWGSEINSPFMEDTLRTARQRGLLVVASAGNEPTNRPVYPAAYEGVIAVSATLPDGQPWPSSNYGDFVTIGAPGTASFPIGFHGGPGAYAGTSIASAYVSHAIGLYLQQHPRATPTQVLRALTQAVQADGTPRNPQTGYGVLTQDALKRFLGR